MAHTYKVWLTIEQLDELGNPVGLSDQCGLPDPLGEFDTLEQAQTLVCRVLDCHNSAELTQSDSWHALYGLRDEQEENEAQRTTIAITADMDEELRDKLLTTLSDFFGRDDKVPAHRGQNHSAYHWDWLDRRNMGVGKSFQLIAEIEQSALDMLGPDEQEEEEE